MKLKILSKRERLVLYLTAGVIVFSIIFNLLLAPFLKNNAKLNNDIKSAEAKLAKYHWLISQKDNLQKNYPTFDSRLAGSREDPVVIILSELESMAKDADIRIMEIRPDSSPKSGGAHKEIMVAIRAEGSTEGYLKFIYNIENSLSFLAIKKFQLRSRSNTGVLEGDFTITQPYS